MRRIFQPLNVCLFIALMVGTSVPSAHAASCEETAGQLEGILKDAGGNPCRTAYRPAILDKCLELRAVGCGSHAACDSRCDECLPPNEQNCLQCRRANGKVEQLSCPSCRGDSIRLVAECIIAQDGSCDTDVTEQPCEGGVCVAEAGAPARCARKFECRADNGWVNRYERLPDGSERKQPEPKPALQCINETTLRSWSCQEDGSYQFSDRSCGAQICVSFKDKPAACLPKFRCETSEGRVRQFEMRASATELVSRDIPASECIDETHARSFSCEPDGSVGSQEQDCAKNDRVCVNGQCVSQCACLPREARAAKKRTAEGQEERLEDKCAVHGLSGIDMATCKEQTLPDGRVECTLSYDFKACRAAEKCSEKKLDCLKDRCEMQGNDAVVLDPDDNEKQRCSGGGKGDRRKRAQCLRDETTASVHCKDGEGCDSGELHDGKGNCVVNKNSCAVSGGVAMLKDPFGEVLKRCEGGKENSSACPAVCAGEDNCFKGDQCAEGEFCKRLESGKFGCRKGKPAAAPQPKAAAKGAKGK